MGNYKPHKEKAIENEIKEYITSLGGLCYKIHGGDLYQETGIPDLLCCWGGLFFGIEVKACYVSDNYGPSPVLYDSTDYTDSNKRKNYAP